MEKTQLFRKSNSKIVLLSARHPFSSSGLGAQMEKFQFCKPVGKRNPGNWATVQNTLGSKPGRGKKFLKEKTCANSVLRENPTRKKIRNLMN